MMDITPIEPGLGSNQSMTHTFHFDRFQVRGATHMKTEFTIDRLGNWTATSKISTKDARFKPIVTLFVEFFINGKGPYPEPVGQPPTDWYPKEIWQENFGKSDEKIIKTNGQHDYLADNFQQLTEIAQAKLKMRVKKRPKLLDKFTKS